MSGFRGLQVRVNAKVDLRTVTITLDPHGLPSITLAGNVRTGDRRVDSSSTATIHTSALTPLGADFIREMKAMFAGAADPPS